MGGQLVIGFLRDMCMSCAAENTELRDVQFSASVQLGGSHTDRAGRG